ncbi:MAG: phage tail tube protein [Gemmatimonadales bacterium]
MPAPAKLMNLSALLLKKEATYGTAIAVTATADGHLLALSDRHPAILTMEYLYDGRLGPSPGNLGDLRRIGPVGRTVSGDIPMRFRGAGTTYAATVLPSLHTMLQISGFDATLGSGAFTYTPTADSTTYASATAEYYKRGEMWRALGVLANWGFRVEGAAPPIHTFGVKGIASVAVADAAMVAPAYQNVTVTPSIAAGLGCTIGDWTAVGVKSATFSMNRTFEPRWGLEEADGHLGFFPTGYDPELRIVVESTALVGTPYHTSGGFDPYLLRTSANDFAVALTVGGVAFNRIKLNLPQAQLVDAVMGNEGAVATTELVIKPYNSTPILNDILNVVCD